MTTKTIAQLKTDFSTNTTLTQAKLHDLLDSYTHLSASAFSNTRTLIVTDHIAASVLNTFISDGPSSKIVFAKEGTIDVDGEVLLPNDKRVTILGEGGVTVRITDTTTDACLFRITNAGSWAGSLYIGNIILRANAGTNQHCIGSDQATRANHSQIIIENIKVSASGYEIFLNNQEYSIAPTFRNIRGNHGIYWGGALHSASNMLVENCRFQSGTKGPQLYIFGARKWTIRNCIFEGSASWDEGINKEDVDKQKTWGILIRNPGPEGGAIEECWFEYWGFPAGDYRCTIDYTYNSGGANRASYYYIKNTSLKKFQAKNSSTTDQMGIVAQAGEHVLPIFTDVNDFNVTGKTTVFISGGALASNLNPFGNNKVTCGNSVISGNQTVSIAQQLPYEIYQYAGGTGIYDRDVANGDWARVVPYVQNHPTHGSTLVLKNTTNRMVGSAFTKNVYIHMADIIRQSISRISPHLLKTAGVSLISGNGYNAGVVQTIGTTFQYRDGFDPEHVIGNTSEQSTGIKNFFQTNNPLVDNCKWVQFFAGSAATEGLLPKKHHSKNYDCFEFPNDPGPPKGTSIEGDICRPLSAASATYLWVCTSAGTSRPISVTGNVTSGSNQVTAISDVTEILIGDYLAITGSDTKYRVTAIDSANDSLTLSTNCDVTTTGVAIAHYAPVWSEKRLTTV